MSTIKDLLVHLGVTEARAEVWGKAYEDAFRKYQINTPNRIAAFFGNIIHECNYFKSLSENLNYSAEGLARTWPNRYSSTGKHGGAPNAKAKSIARNPKAIANHCYANRMGNGSESSGDGWNYRGRGPIQVTGKTNYQNLQRRSGLDCINNPDILSTPEGGAISSCDYWKACNINKYADKGDFDGTADLINLGRKTARIGDAIGYADRKKVYDKALAWFKKYPNFSLPDKKTTPVEMEFDVQLGATSTNQITIVADENVEAELKKTITFEM